MITIRIIAGRIHLAVRGPEHVVRGELTRDQGCALWRELGNALAALDAGAADHATVDGLIDQVGRAPAR